MICLFAFSEMKQIFVLPVMVKHSALESTATMTCLLKILLSERMDKLEYHPYLTKNSVCEVPAKFSALSRKR